MSTTRRSTRNSNTEESFGVKDILNEISQKLDHISGALQQLCENQQKNKETNTSACKTLVSAISTIEQNITPTMRRSETKILKDEVLKQRQGIIKIWKSQINKRKQLYWHSLNCENTAAIYVCNMDREG